jgi:hypothetical protein
MPSRGVMLGDVSRANDAWNERIGAAGAGAGVDTEVPGTPGTLSSETTRAMADDLFDAGESKLIMGDLVHSYTTMTGGVIGEMLLSMAGHALAIGVLTERQRWEGEGMSVPDAKLKGALERASRVIAGLLEHIHEIEHPGEKDGCEHCRTLLEGVGNG